MFSKIPQQAKLVSMLRQRVAEGLPDRHVAELCSILGGSAINGQVQRFVLGRYMDHKIQLHWLTRTTVSVLGNVIQLFVASVCASGLARNCMALVDFN